MKPSIKKSIGALCAGVALCAPLMAAPAGGPIGETIIKPYGILWEVQLENDGLILSVRGRDCVLDQSFDRGETPKLDIGDFAGVRLEDGHYGWELRAVPAIDPEVREALASARKLGDPAAEKELAMQLRRDGKIPWQQITQSGYFTIDRGEIILEKTEKGPAIAEGEADPIAKAGVEVSGLTPTTKDFVILDDLIVDGSACIGFDCVNGESFGFDTIRLKENNLRIKFDDTSVAASFPRNDWQLTANDSANGGASKFSIDDISGGRTPFTVEANAPSHSLYVDDGGRVGFGTSTPVAELHVVDGDTPTLRLAQDGSSGFAPQTWDVAGNETSFFVRDATNGSTLPFRIRPGAASNALVIGTDSNVGVGVLSPSQQLEVVGNVKAGKTTGGTTSFFIENTGGANDSSWILRANSSNGAFTFTEAGANTPFRIFKGAASNTLDITSTGVNVVGTLSVGGVGLTVPDYVFEPDYQLKSLEEQRAFFTENKHLPAVPKAKLGPDGRPVVDLIAYQLGMLEELEKAHLYIQQLEARLTKLEAANE